ncbi:SIR2 family NAD-dependent protein deacylase [Paraburkholderia humisilvae]|uniref:protein acetyllysine N-acetyltransferase n=1 Tax=Paraburkholderia humisilvae TaxID=627669 RepID=A0A6J5DS05_9BURK|nr:Sir2 family NAD-dependent protein deacetylase [Paraburkholderia humisilvae]CAB3756397.1 NAD-dependent protein deacylase sirtuin-5, mitochondrial [Paraburkholderia humisilvae]
MTPPLNIDAALDQAASWLRTADGLLITAGAGMGVDSGLPDFRGPEGFWRAYPALRDRGLSFEDVANPAHFIDDPTLAWGFYGHRLALYRATVPHEGFSILLRWSMQVERGAFVFTSNVDGQFQKAGFADDRVAECHGTIHALQCTRVCTNQTWSASGFAPIVDEETARVMNDMPLCPRCGCIARPNILMFGDYDWIERRTREQYLRLDQWLRSVKRVVVVELGAGTALPTVRRFSERHGPRVIRINPRDTEIAAQVGVGIAGRAAQTLRLLDARLNPARTIH